MDKLVEVPTNNVTFLEFVGLVFDTVIIFEDELEDRLWTFLAKIDTYIYAIILAYSGRMMQLGPIYLSSEYICT